MLTEKDYELIDSLLQKENVNEFMSEFIKLYSKNNVTHCLLLLGKITNLTDELLRIKESELVRKYRALYMSLMLNQNGKMMPPQQRFAAFVPICMEIVPNGHFLGGESRVTKDVFEEFLNLFKRKDVFDWERDSDWFKNCGYYEYLKKVETLNFPKKEGGDK